MSTDGKLKQGRRPRTVVEAEFFDQMQANSWMVSGRAWPDFLCQNGDRWIAVEVQPDAAAKVREQKRVALDLLAAVGVECYLWSPDGGLVRWTVGGGKGEGFSFDVGTQEDDNGQQQTIELPLPPTPLSEPEKPQRSEIAESIDRIWEHYVTTMQPRSKKLDDQARTLIRAALNVASEDEIKLAITGCYASDFHMARGKWAGQKKYNRLSQIIRGRRGKETTRERIDWFIEKAEQAHRGEKESPSADAAIVEQKTAAVRRGYHQPDDDELVAQAKEAEEWLAAHGITTIRRSDGYPTFKRTGLVKGGDGA